MLTSSSPVSFIVKRLRRNGILSEFSKQVRLSLDRKGWIVYWVEYHPGLLLRTITRHPRGNLHLENMIQCWCFRFVQWSNSPVNRLQKMNALAKLREWFISVNLSKQVFYHMFSIPGLECTDNAQVQWLQIGCSVWGQEPEFHITWQVSNCDYEKLHYLQKSWFIWIFYPSIYLCPWPIFVILKKHLFLFGVSIINVEQKTNRLHKVSKVISAHLLCLFS